MNERTIKFWVIAAPLEKNETGFLRHILNFGGAANSTSWTQHPERAELFKSKEEAKKKHLRVKRDKESKTAQNSIIAKMEIKLIF